jgi:hypothetical protein
MVVVIDAVVVVDAEVVVVADAVVVVVLGPVVVEVLDGAVVLSGIVLVEVGTVSVVVTSGSAARSQLADNGARTRRSTRSVEPPISVLLTSHRPQRGCYEPGLDAIGELSALRGPDRRAGSSRCGRRQWGGVGLTPSTRSLG